MPHVLAHDFDTAGIRNEQSSEELEQRGLAGTIRTQQRDKFAGLRGETYAIHSPDRAIGFHHAIKK